MLYEALITVVLFVLAIVSLAAAVSMAVEEYRARRRARRDDPLGVARAIGMLDSNTRRLQAERRDLANRGGAQ